MNTSKEYETLCRKFVNEQVKSFGKLMEYDLFHTHKVVSLCVLRICEIVVAHTEGSKLPHLLLTTNDVY